MALPAFETLVEEEAAPLPAFDALVDDTPAFDDLVDEPAAPAPLLTPEQLQQSQQAGMATLDMLTLPARFDWSQVAEEKDKERFAQYISLRNQADELEKADPSQSLNLNSPANVLRRQAFGIQQQMSPGTAGGLGAASMEQGALRSSAEAMQREQTPRETFRVPNPFARGLSGFLGPALSSQVLPIAEEAGRNLGGAGGGALGASMMLMPGGGLLRFLLPLGGGFVGSQLGAQAQENVQQATETPQDTAIRHQQIAEQRAQFPVSTDIGRLASNAPFFGFSLREIARAAMGDRAARQNLGVAGAIGAGMVKAGEYVTGQKATLGDIARGAVENMLMNRPTPLGRALGFHGEVSVPKIEQPQFRDAQQISETSPPDGGVRPPEVPPQDVPLSTPEGGEGVQPGRPGEPLAQAAPAEARQIAPLQEIIPALKINGETIIGRPGDTHEDIFNRYFEGKDPDEKLLARADFDAPKRNPNFFVDAAGNPISREQLKEAYGVSSSQELRKLQIEEAKKTAAAAKAPTGTRTEEELIAELVSRGVPEEVARAERARISPETQTGTTPPPPSTGEPAARGGVAEGPTGIRNAIVDAARAERALPERELPGRRAFGTVWDEAKAAVAQDPTAGRRLVNSLKEQVRPLTDAEDAVLTYEQTQREAERDAALEAVNNAKTPEEMEAAQERLTMADNEIFDIYQVGQEAGTANARGLNARRLMINRDFTLARMLNETRAVVNNGKPLSKEQTAEVTALHERIADLEKKLAESGEKTARNEARAEYQRMLRETRQEAKTAAKTKTTITDFFEAQAEKARQRIINRRGRLQTTVDPLNIAGLVDEAIIGASYVAKGVRNFAEWSKRMLNEFGDRIKPQLQALFARAQEIEQQNAQAFQDAVETPEQVLSGAEGKINQKVIFDLARAHINAGVDGFENVMAAVQKNLDPIQPGITQREINDAFSGYGKTTQPSKAEDLKTLREYRNIARLMSQLEDAQKKLMPLKTGPQRDKPTARVRELQKQVNDAMREAGLQRTSPEQQLASGLDASKTRLRNAIEDLQRRINRNDYAERTRTEPALDREKIDLQFALENVRHEYQQGLIKAKRAQRTFGKKVKDSFFETFNLFHQILTSGDLPPVLRQGLFSIGRPVMMAKALRDSFKAMASEKQRFKINKEIQDRPNAPLYSRSKLYLAKDTGQSLTQQEEAYMGNWFKSLPRWTVVGPLLRASERSYNTFLNKLRADTFDVMKEAYGVPDTDTFTLKRMADIINTMTGRSKLPGSLERAAAGANMVLFSPRFLASRFKLVAGEPLWTGNAKTRTFALEQYARTLAGTAIIYGLAKMAGGEIELDPRSTDFGKIRFGNTRLDPLGGLAQVTTFLTRIITGEKKTGKGKLVPLREGARPLEGTSMGARGRPTTFTGGMGDTIGTFLRTKLAPLPSTAMNVFTGRDLGGQPVAPESTIKSLAVPISYQDILKTMEDQGVPRGTALWVLSLFGAGLKTYDR